MLALLACLVPACSQAPPSREECVARWNAVGNEASRSAVADLEFPHAYVDGWPTQAGDYCSATFFTHRGEPWVLYVLWVDAPNPTTLFQRNVDGSRYGEGQLGAERPISPNAQVSAEGLLVEPAVTP